MSEALRGSSGETCSLSLSGTQSGKLKPHSASASPCGSPRMSPCDSPRHSPLLFRKLLVNRSIALQRRFTLAHTPRYCHKIKNVIIFLFIFPNFLQFQISKLHRPNDCLCYVLFTKKYLLFE